MAGGEAIPGARRAAAATSARSTSGAGVTPPRPASIPNARLEFEQQLREAGQEPALAPPLVEAIRLGPADYERAQAAAPRRDIDELERQWREWIADKPRPANPGGAFVAFCRKKVRRMENRE